MNEHPRLTPPDDELETIVQETARHFVFPPTPDIAGRLRQRREKRLAARVWQVATVLLVVCIIVTITVPSVQAFVLEIIRIGAVRILLIEPTATPTLTPTISATAAATARPTRTPRPTPEVLSSVLELAGETRLADAQAITQNRILLPAYPAGLGAPDRVFVQEMNAPVVTLVWTVPGAPEQVQMSIEVLDNAIVANKLYPVDGQRQSVVVNGRSAEWLTGVHEVWYFGGGIEFGRVVTTPVLIWQDADGLLTYRLEAQMPLEEAIRTAESMVEP